jgi:hypothetical protein
MKFVRAHYFSPAFIEEKAAAQLLRFSVKGAPHDLANGRNVRKRIDSAHELQVLLETDDNMHLWPNVFFFSLHYSTKEENTSIGENLHL